MLVARDDETCDIVGVMWVQKLGPTPCYFIPYYAIDRIHQSHGIGHALFHFACEFLQEKGNIDVLLWEIEVPDLQQQDDQRVKRLHFYEKNGGHVVEYAKHFTVPDVTNCGESMPLWLMVAPIGDYNLVNDAAHAYQWMDAILRYDIDYSQCPDHRDHILRQMQLQLTA
jgi:hypothetical protein